MILRWKTPKKSIVGGKLRFFVMTSLDDVITSKFYLIWKVLIKDFHMRYYTIWFHCFQNLTLGWTIFTLGLTIKVKADWSPNLISWVADHMLLSHQIWSWSDVEVDLIKGTKKLRVSLTPCLDHKMTLTLEWWPSVTWLLLVDNNARDVI
jgi:hypothetical protein